MISLKAISSSKSATGYFFEHANDSKVEYYANEKVENQWGGSGTAYANLSAGGDVDKLRFTEIMEGNIHNALAGESQQLGRMINGVNNHICGHDLTFSAPKSVSIVAEIGDDPRVRAAHEAAVERAMWFLEKNAAQVATTAAGGEKVYTDTGNLLYAKFQHDTSRALDPNTHTHVVVMNATFDKASGKWKSLANQQLFTLRASADRVYMNELAFELKTLGYELRFDKDGKFEIEGITESQIGTFSKRSNTIEDELENMGKTRETASNALKQKITLDTREQKKNMTREALLEAWKKEGKEVGLDVTGITKQAGLKSILKDKYDAEAGLRYAKSSLNEAMLHLGEREQTLNFKELVSQVTRFNQGRSRYGEIERAINLAVGSGELIKKKDGKFTTLTAFALEKEQGDMIQNGKYAVESIASAEAIEAGIAAYEKRMSKDGKPFQFRDEQKDMIQAMLGGKHRHGAVQGLAGVGKTAALACVKEIAEAHGYEVIGLSAYNEQAAILEQDSGIKSVTVARYLLDQKKLQEQADKLNTRDQSKPVKLETDIGNYYQVGANVYVERRGILNPLNELRARLNMKTKKSKAGVAMTMYAKSTLSAEQKKAEQERQKTIMAAAGKTAEGKQKKVLVINDEASLTSQADMVNLFRDIETKGYRVWNVGDAKQHQGVSAGKAHELSVQQGIQTVQLVQMGRQQDETGKLAAADIVAGRNMAAFDKLKKVEIESNDKLIEALAKDFVTDTKGQIVVTASNADRVKINEAVRAELKRTGAISGDDVVLGTLRQTGMTDVERRRVFSYEPGFVLESGQDYKHLGIEKGEQITVQAVDQSTNRLDCMTTGGKRISIDIGTHTAFTAYTLEPSNYAVGDQIRFTANDKSKAGIGVNNNQKGVVLNVSKGKMVVLLDGGRKVTVEGRMLTHIEHGYASTSYKAQGATKDRALIHINPASPGAMSNRAWYVEATRARFGSVVYTTSSEKARNLVDRAQDKTSALDLHTEKEKKIEAAEKRIKSSEIKIRDLEAKIAKADKEIAKLEKAYEVAGANKAVAEQSVQRTDEAKPNADLEKVEAAKHALDAAKEVKAKLSQDHRKAKGSLDIAAGQMEAIKAGKDEEIKRAAEQAKLDRATTSELDKAYDQATKIGRPGWELDLAKDSMKDATANLEQCEKEARLANTELADIQSVQKAAMTRFSKSEERFNAADRGELAAERTGTMRAGMATVDAAGHVVGGVAKVADMTAEATIRLAGGRHSVIGGTLAAVKGVTAGTIKFAGKHSKQFWREKKDAMMTAKREGKLDAHQEMQKSMTGMELAKVDLNQADSRLFAAESRANKARQALEAAKKDVAERREWITSQEKSKEKTHQVEHLIDQGRGKEAAGVAREAGPVEIKTEEQLKRDEWDRNAKGLTERENAKTHEAGSTEIERDIDNLVKEASGGKKDQKRKKQIEHEELFSL